MQDPASRDRVLQLLRPGPGTVNDLAAALRLTDNAVRAHLANLQADGLVEAAGQRPGPAVLRELAHQIGEKGIRHGRAILSKVECEECGKQACVELSLRACRKWWIFGSRSAACYCT